VDTRLILPSAGEYNAARTDPLWDHCDQDGSAGRAGKGELR
jgi:hypothetical protein